MPLVTFKGPKVRLTLVQVHCFNPGLSLSFSSLGPWSSSCSSNESQWLKTACTFSQQRTGRPSSLHSNNLPLPSCYPPSPSRYLPSLPSSFSSLSLSSHQIPPLSYPSSCLLIKLFSLNRHYHKPDMHRAQSFYDVYITLFRTRTNKNISCTN